MYMEATRLIVVKRVNTLSDQLAETLDISRTIGIYLRNLNCHFTLSLLKVTGERAIVFP